jgi:DNA-binding transcriptional ArsR family regulator
MAQRHDPDLRFKALADLNRRKLLDVLHADDGRTLNELCGHLDMTRQGVHLTQHLALLEEANLVATVRRGREKLHFLNPVQLKEIYERWIAKSRRKDEPSADRPRVVLVNPGDSAELWCSPLAL